MFAGKTTGTHQERSRADANLTMRTKLLCFRTRAKECACKFVRFFQSCLFVWLSLSLSLSLSLYIYIYIYLYICLHLPPSISLSLPLSCSLSLVWRTPRLFELTVLHMYSFPLLCLPFCFSFSQLHAMTRATRCSARCAGFTPC